MRARKTIKIAALLEEANRALARDDNSFVNSQFRQGIATFLESILYKTGNYHGYNAIAWLNGGYVDWIRAGKPEDLTPFLGDETKRRYYSAPMIGPKTMEHFPKMLKG